MTEDQIQAAVDAVCRLRGISLRADYAGDSRRVDIERKQDDLTLARLKNGDTDVKTGGVWLDTPKDPKRARRGRAGALATKRLFNKLGYKA